MSNKKNIRVKELTKFKKYYTIMPNIILAFFKEEKGDKNERFY